jgi:hypothetical protein
VRLDSRIDIGLWESTGARVIVVVKALCYKLEGRGFETQCGK